MTTSYQHIEQRPPIEATFIKYDSSYDDQLVIQLEEEKLKNKKLLQELENNNNNLKIAYQNLDAVKKLNHKLEQDTKFYKIQVINLKNINDKFIRTINNLQSYRVYVADLLAKRIRTNNRINRLVKEVKNLQNIIRQKNVVIRQKTKAYGLAKLQAAHIIKETYGI